MIPSLPADCGTTGSEIHLDLNKNSEAVDPNKSNHQSTAPEFLLGSTAPEFLLGFEAVDNLQE